MYKCIRCGGVVGEHYFTSDQFWSAIDKMGEIIGTPEFLGNHDVGDTISYACRDCNSNVGKLEEVLEIAIWEDEE